MKSCPKCNRTFPDEGQKFCTFDGGLLIAPQTFDPNATIRATSIDLNQPDNPTSRDLPDLNATVIESFPAQTVALTRDTGPTGPPPTTPPTAAPTTADIVSTAPPPPVSPPPPPPPPQQTQPTPPPPPQQHTSAPLAEPPQAAATSAPLPQPPVAAPKKSKAPLIIAGVLVFLLIGGAALAAAFFFVFKPMLDKRAAEQNENENRPIAVVQPSAEPSATIEQPSPTPEETYSPRPNTTQFQNSNANLDGKLAEHYFDFSFYYPSSWQLDPKAGVPGASNFVKVERSLEPNVTQENFAVGWYRSTGTFIGDLNSFPQRVEEVSAALAKAYPEYRKISDGPTKVNSMDAYEFRWEGLYKETDRGDIHLWGRVVFLPTGREGDTTGATLAMLSTSLAPELSSVKDIGEKGEATVILESFRFGKKQ